MSSVFFTKRIKVTAGGYTYTQWKVEGRLKGVRIRKFFPSREEAEGYRQLKEVEAINGSHELRPSVTHLTADQLRQAEAAFKRLGDKPLLAAVDWYLDTYRDTLTKKTVTESYPDFLNSIRDEVRPSTIDDYTSSLKAFGEFTDKRSLPEIRGDDIEAFLNKRGLKKKSWNNTRADLHAFFAWAERPPRKWITSNPVAEVKTMSVTRGLPEIVSVITASELMAFVATYRGQGNDPKPAGFLVPYFSLALFAGIRPAINEGELVRMGRIENRASLIDLKNKVIRITPEIAKTKDVRQVTIQPNLAAWLKAFPLDIRDDELPRRVTMRHLRPGLECAAWSGCAVRLPSRRSKSGARLCGKVSGEASSTRGEFELKALYRRGRCRFRGVRRCR